MSLPMVISATVFGGAASAFLPLVAHRLAVPSGVPPRSSCADCGTPYPDGPDGWVCAGPPCNRPASFRAGLGPWCTIATGATASGLLAASIGATPLLPVLLLAVVLGVLLAVIDMRCLRLPDPLVAALALLTVPVLAALGGPEPIVRGVLAAGLSFLAYAMIAILPRGGLGFGDVKLAAVLGFVLGFLGWPTLLLGVLLPHLINGPIALFLLGKGRVGRRSALPLGPALLTGALLAIVLT